MDADGEVDRSRRAVISTTDGFQAQSDCVALVESGSDVAAVENFERGLIGDSVFAAEGETVLWRATDDGKLISVGSE